MRKRFIQIDGQLHEVSSDWRQEPKADIHIMPDIQPYRSMIDGTMIMSRSHHREHLRQHNCVEVGNDSSLYKRPEPVRPPPNLKQDIIEAVNRVEQRHRR